MLTIPRRRATPQAGGGSALAFQHDPTEGGKGALDPSVVDVMVKDQTDPIRPDDVNPNTVAFYLAGKLSRGDPRVRTELPIHHGRGGGYVVSVVNPTTAHGSHQAA